jgi:hypothetical protein
MKTKYTNTVMDLLVNTKAHRAVFNMWGGQTPIAMGDGIKFRVTKSPFVDYVYVKYLAGAEAFEIEFGALVGSEYDVIDRIKPVDAANLVPTISRKLFGFQIVDEEEPPKAAAAAV